MGKFLLDESEQTEFKEKHIRSSGKVNEVFSNLLETQVIKNLILFPWIFL